VPPGYLGAPLYHPPMEITVAPLGRDDLDEALPLFAGYQRFYRAEPDDERNRRFFSRFLHPSDVGLLLGAWADGALVGFATLYWTHSSSRAGDIALMNDLFVKEEARGVGAGYRLIDACAAAAGARGLPVVEWYTATDNERAQRLYDRYPGARRTSWYAYEIETPRTD
jgi:ribosomal protein S18 acetylase RimI-like enzyme